MTNLSLEWDKDIEYDVAIIVLSGVAEVKPQFPGAEVLSLPSKNSHCPSSKKLFFTGWGKDQYKNQEAIFFNAVPATKFLFGIHLQCTQDKTNDPIILATDAKYRRNSVCNGDSGGMSI